MENRLESLVKKHKKAGKTVVVGKIVGGLAGIAVGVFIGKEIPEFLDGNYSDFVLFGMKMSPAILFGYLGQKVGGLVGTGYYILNGNNKNDSQSL